MSEMLVDDLSTHETIPLSSDVEHTSEDVEHKSDDHDLSISTVDIVQETIVELLKTIGCRRQL